MPSKDRLRAYRERRDFDTTSEPEGSDPAEHKDEPIFVIQKHAARTTHYDFRIEVDGVLKSWAVPKGPSTAPRDRRLAIPTEDHPLDYAHFEGVVPPDEYGAGPVIVWDTGTYRNIKEHGEPGGMSQALASGHVEIWLEGKKLRGGYALIRTGKDRRERERWLLVKMKDEAADPARDPVADEPQSVLSGKTVEDVAEKEGTGEKSGEQSSDKERG
ncbi:MAG: DNA polymerase ligase N-terminal domain-containing protein [bacterium]